MTPKQPPQTEEEAKALFEFLVHQRDRALDTAKMARDKAIERANQDCYDATTYIINQFDKDLFDYGLSERVPLVKRK
jgi:hypothetical protein